MKRDVLVWGTIKCYYLIYIVIAGGNGGNEQTYTFKEDEYITSIKVCKAKKN